MTNLEEKIIKFLDLEKNSLLHLATSANDIELVKELITNGADIDAINKAGQSILTIALNLKDKTLIKDYFPTLNFKENTKNNLLYYLNTSNLTLLEPYKLDSQKIMNKLNYISEKESHLHQAVETYSLPLIEKLLSEGANPNALYHKETPLHRIYNYSNKKKITAKETIDILKLFKKYGYDETIKYNDLNLAEYVMHRAHKKSSKVFDYFLKENYQLDLLKSVNRRLVFEFNLSEEQINQYFLDKITEQNYMTLPIKNYYWVSSSNNIQNRELVVKLLDKIKNENWTINYDIQAHDKAYKTNASFYFSLMIDSRDVLAQHKEKYDEFLAYFATKIDLNQAVEHTQGFSRNSHTSSLARLMFGENLHKKIDLPIEKINFNDEVEYEAGSIASKLITQSIKAYHEENIDKYLPFIDFSKLNTKGQSVLHEVFIEDTTYHLRQNKLSDFLVKLLENNTIDLNLQNSEGKTILSYIQKYEYPKEFIEKLTLTNMTSINNSNQTNKKLKI